MPQLRYKGLELTLEAGESVLDALRTKLPIWLLQWHYRSLDERLIAFANRHIYEDCLVTFPSAAPDDALLSTAHGRPTAYIAVHQYVGMEFETYFRAVEDVMDDYDGRPHWGKRHYQTAATLRRRYPEWDRFIEIRDRLDPERDVLEHHAAVVQFWRL